VHPTSHDTAELGPGIWTAYARVRVFRRVQRRRFSSSYHDVSVLVGASDSRGLL
jgi:hypothetical protein